jgi:hypothetical protein
MASKFIVPFEIPNYLGTPADHADTGFVLMYVKYGWLRRLSDGSEVDLVLQRPLDGFDATTAVGPIVPTDTVLQAFKKIQTGITSITLSGDVTGTAAYDGSGNLVISTTLSGGSNPGIWDTTQVDSTIYGDVVIDGVHNSYGWTFDNLSAFTVAARSVSLTTYDEVSTYANIDIDSSGLTHNFFDGTVTNRLTIAAKGIDLEYLDNATNNKIGLYLYDKSFRVWTDGIQQGTAINGQVLRLVDSSNGEAEWATPTVDWANVTGAPTFANIYNADGTLTANRTVTQAGNNLTFTGGKIFVNGSADSWSSDFVLTGRLGVKPSTSTAASFVLSNPGGTLAFVKWRSTDPGSMGLPAGHGEIQDGSGGLAIWAHGDIKFGYDNGFRMGLYGATGNVTIGASDTDAGYKLNVIGTLKVSSDFTFGGTQNFFINTNPYIFYNRASTAGGITFAPANVIDNASSNAIVIFDTNYGNIQYTTGTYTFNALSVLAGINVAAGYTGTIRGFYHNPTITSIGGATHYAFESTSGSVKISTLAGTGTRMVVASSTGVLSTQTIPSGSGLTIGSSAITSGTVGRILFEGIGSVLQESANLNWDSTNSRLAVGSSSFASFTLDVTGTARITNNLSVGTPTLTTIAMLVSKDLTGATTQTHYSAASTVQSDVTTSVMGYHSAAKTLAAAFTLAKYYHFYAQQSTIGAGSAIAEQYGYYVDSTLTGGTTNNFGFYGGLNSAAKVFNLYMAGTAANYLAGSLKVGTNDTALASALFNVDSTTQGAIFPRMTSTQRTAITSPAVGLLVYQTDATEGYYENTSTGWRKINGNQTITLSGDVSGSGTTAITATLATITQSTGANFVKITLDTKGRVTGNTAVSASDMNTAYGSQTANTVYAAPNGSAGTPTFRALVAADIPALNYQATSTNLTSLAGLTFASTSFVKMTAAGTFALDTNTYLTANQSITLSGDISGTGTTAITTSIGANKVTNAMLAQVATGSFLGRVTAATGNVETLTGTQATTLLNVFTSTLKGLVPASGGGTTTYLRADGTWATPAGGGGGAGTTTNALTSNNGGAGAASGATFDGSAPITISYNTVGALSAANPAYTGVLTTGTLTYSATNHMASLQSSINAYNQFVLQNSNAGATASSDVVVNNDVSTDTTFYGDFGMNSSGFTGSGSFNLPSAVYLASAGGDLVLGTYTSNAIRFVVNSGTSDAFRIGTTGNLMVNQASDAGYKFDVNGTSRFQSNVLFGVGTASNAPFSVTLTSAVLKTTAAAGDFEVDTLGVPYYTHAASSRGIIDSTQYMALSGTYTLTSQTAAQKIFNATTNGALNVQGGTTYFFECFYSLTGMSATSGSFGFAIGGTATLTSIGWHSIAYKTTANATAGSATTTYNSTAANTAIATANTLTAGLARITGIIRINATGTIIPQVSLGNAAAAIVGANSYFRITPIGSGSVTTLGNWS